MRAHFSGTILKQLRLQKLLLC